MQTENLTIAESQQTSLSFGFGFLGILPGLVESELSCVGETDVVTAVCLLHTFTFEAVGHELHVCAGGLLLLSGSLVHLSD